MDERHKNQLVAMQTISGNINCTKMQQAKTGEPRESRETKPKKQSKKRKVNPRENFYLQKTAKKFGM